MVRPCRTKGEDLTKCMNDSAYKKSFELFLSRTDEKSVIKKFIENNIGLDRKMSFLDIGGGNGSLTSLISGKVGSTTVVEPNKDFFRQLKQKKDIETINRRWEEVHLRKNYDFILAAYVITFFPEHKREELLEKVYRHLRPNGKMLILSIDAQNGSWREIHTYFYQLMGYVHRSSDDALKKWVQKYRHTATTFRTDVVAKNIGEMLELLYFDFGKHPEEFSGCSQKLKEFLKTYTNKDGKVTLEMVHNAFIIYK